MAATSEDALKPMWEKLSYLVGLCYPSYTTQWRMIAPIIKLTLGDIFKGMPGFIRGVTITPDETATWELDADDYKARLPKVVDISFEFVVIGHHLQGTLSKHYDFLPLKGRFRNTNRKGLNDRWIPDQLPLVDSRVNVALDRVKSKIVEKAKDKLKTIVNDVVIDSIPDLSDATNTLTSELNKIVKK